MSKSDYLENELLKWCTGQVNALGTAPTPYVALFTTVPAEDGTGGVASARARVTSAGAWGTPAAGSVSNTAEIAFATHGSAENIVGFGIYDALTNGNLLRVASFTLKAVGAGDTPRFSIGQLTLTED